MLDLRCRGSSIATSSGHRLSFSQGPPLWFRSHTIAGRSAVRAGTHGMSCQGPPAVSNCKIPPDIGIRNIHGMGCQHREAVLQAALE